MEREPPNPAHFGLMLRSAVVASRFPRPRHRPSVSAYSVSFDSGRDSVQTHYWVTLRATGWVLGSTEEEEEEEDDKLVVLGTLALVDFWPVLCEWDRVVCVSTFFFFFWVPLV